MATTIDRYDASETFTGSITFFTGILGVQCVQINSASNRSVVIGKTTAINMAKDILCHYGETLTKEEVEQWNLSD